MVTIALSSEPLRSTRPCVSSNTYFCPIDAPATRILRPATSTLNCGVTAVTVRPIPKQFLQELDDFGLELLLDRALLLDFALLELDFGVTLELLEDLALEDDFAELLLDLGADEELDETTLEELDFATPKCAVINVSP